jgi:exodeoxyribonuclease V beta subunit
MKPFDVTQIPLRGRNLVDASAGTGKTYAIATLFVRLLLETEHSPTQLLVVTFTEAATAELRDRIRKRVRECLVAASDSDGDARPELDPTLLAIMARAGDRDRIAARLREALYDFDNVEISTIHGFCQRMLMERALESDVTFNSQLYGDARPMIDELILDYWANHAGPAAPELLAYMRTEGSKFGVDLARRLAYTVLRTPDVRVLPDAPSAEDPPDFERFRAELARAREVWQRYDVPAVIAASNVRKTSYNSRHTPNWARAVGEFFAADAGLFLSPPKCFERFCTPKLIEAGGGLLGSHELFLTCDRLLAEHQRLARALRAEVLRFKLGLLDYLKTELPRRTGQLRQLSFDDLLDRLHAALHGRSGQELARSIRERYPAALIDEFQDTDPRQLAIFERIYSAPNTSLFLIGDPKQAIYSFRGADVFSYVAAAQRTGAERHFTMTTNYRSDPRMVAAVNHLLSSTPHPFLLPEIRFEPVLARPGARDVLIEPDGRVASGLEILVPEESEGTDRGLGSDWITGELPALIAREIQGALGDGLECKGEKLAPGDIAVLTRTNDQAFQIQAALRRVGVTSVVLGDKSVYDSDEAHELERLLAAVVEPTNQRAIRAALTTDLLGVTAADLARMDENESEWETWSAAFHNWSGIWAQSGFVQMMRVLLTWSRVHERLLALPDGERRLTNLLQLIELLHAAGSRSHLGPSGLFGFLGRERRRDIIGMEAEAAQIRLESDADAVKITTMHKSKGLEYPVVYCPYLWHGMLLHTSDEQAPKLHLDGGELVLDIGSPDQKAHIERARFEVFAENLRLLYVALTRARHRCSIVWGRIGKYSTSALGYVLYPPPPQAAAPGGSGEVLVRGIVPSDAAPAEGSTSVEDDLSAQGSTPAEGSAPNVDAIQAHLSALDDAAWTAQLERLAAAAPIMLRRPRADAPRSEPAREGARARPLAARRATLRIDDRWRTSSFSALTSHAPTAESREEQIADHDALAPSQPPPEPPELERTIRLADFPRGTKAGSFFHDILEHYDFESPRPGPLLELVESRLTSYRYPVEPWKALVAEQIGAVLDTPLCSTDAGPLRLADVPLGERLNELEFCVPVGTRNQSPEGRAINAFDLARVFREHPSEALPVRYADAVSRLGFIPLAGFLRGFIDLVFRHGERFYLVDYKGNSLGPSPADFAREKLGDAMLRGQYFLQYHLYALALHRYLGRRIGDYSFERHFGGVFYLFIKGMDPEHGDAGVFYEKPPLERLAALGRLLERDADDMRSPAPEARFSP